LSYLFNEVDGGLEVEPEVDELPLNAFTLIFLLFEDEHLEEEKRGKLKGKSVYSEFCIFRLLLASRLLKVDFDHFKRKLPFFEAAGGVAKIGSSLKLNHHCLL
jgi:hypothetical protein